MTGTELRSARRALNTTPEQVATLVGVEPRDIDAWEADRTIPRKYRHAVDAALWQLECDAAVRKAGIHECAWTPSLDIAGRPNPDEIVQHIGSCPTCQARSEHIRTHVRPEPIGGNLTAQAFGIVARLTGWQQAAVAGAMLLLGMAGIGIPILLVLAVVRQDLDFVWGAGALLITLVVSGAAGGLVHYWTAPLREQGTAAYYASWVLTMYGYMLAALGLVTLAPVVLGPDAAGDDLPTLTDPASWAVFGILGIFFGIALGRGARSAETAVPAPEQKRSIFSLRNIALVVLVLGGIGLRYLAQEMPASPEEWQASLPQIQAAAQAKPDDPDAQKQLAWALVGLERWDEAEPVLERAVRLNPRDADLHNSLGWTQMQRRQFEAALPLLRRAIQLAPEHPNAHHNLAWALYNLDRLEEAERAYRKAITLNPEHGGVHGELGWVLHGMRRLGEAETEFRTAIRLDPNDAWHHDGLGFSVMQSGRLEEALPPLREAARLAPENAKFWADLGHAAHLAGAHPEAAAAFARAEQVEPGFVSSHPLWRAMWDASRQEREYTPVP